MSAYVEDNSKILIKNLNILNISTARTFLKDNCVEKYILLLLLIELTLVRSGGIAVSVTTDITTVTKCFCKKKYTQFSWLDVS